MLQPVVIMIESIASIIWWINVNTFNLPSKLLLQCLQGQQIIAEDKPVVEDILVRHPVRRMIRLLRVLQQNPRLQPRPILFSDPGEFKLLFFSCHCYAE